MSNPATKFLWTVPVFCTLITPIPGEEFELRVVDAQTRKPVSVRMIVRNSRGAIIRQRGVPYHAGYFCFFGTHIFKLPRGVYSYVIEKGPEYRAVSGQFEIKRGSGDGISVAIPRYVNLNEKGWWAGDLEIHRDLKDIPVLMDANDLQFANVIAQINEEIQFKDGFPKETFHRVSDSIQFCQTGVLDQRLGGGLIAVGSAKKLDTPPIGSPLPLKLVPKDTADLVVMQNASGWDLPLLLAEHARDRRPLDAICIAGDAVAETQGKKKRPDLRPPPENLNHDHPNAYWQTVIYYHLLNCGFRIPPVAASAAGRSQNPVGYNRTYVHTGLKYSPEQWLQNLKQGRVIVTNGPVMQVHFNGVLPGEVFKLDQGKSIAIQPSLTLSLKEKAEYLEIVRNGLVAKKITLDEYAKARGALPSLRFSESGWMLVRVVTGNRKAFHFASSGPVYVEIGQQPIRRKQSAQFFLDWTIQRGRMIRNSEISQRDAILERWRLAYEFWKQMASE